MFWSEKDNEKKSKTKDKDSGVDTPRSPDSLSFFRGDPGQGGGAIEEFAVELCVADFFQ